MKKHQLEPFIYELFDYFGYDKRPNDKRIDLIAKQLDFVPCESATYIFEEMKQLDSVPRNIPKVIKGIFFNWKNNNPQKMIHDKTSCKYCYGDGCIVFEKGGYDFQCRCGHCQNWRIYWGENSSSMLTVQEIKAMGGKRARNYRA